MVGVSTSPLLAWIGSSVFPIRWTVAPGTNANTSCGPVRSSCWTCGKTRKPICNVMAMNLQMEVDALTIPRYDLAKLSINPRFTPTRFQAMNNAQRRIDILAFADVQLLDVAGPLQAFASANELSLARGADAPYLARVVAATAGEIQSTAGLGLLAQPLPAAQQTTDTLIVAGGRGVHAASKDPAQVAWVRERAAQCRRVASVCTGAFLLAAAGLLDERRAVTHWAHCEHLGERY